MTSLEKTRVEGESRRVIGEEKVRRCEKARRERFLQRLTSFDRSVERLKSSGRRPSREEAEEREHRQVARFGAP
jgi:hypothetical protein